MKALLDVLQWTQWILFGALAIVTLRLWRRHRSEAAAWAAATFGSLALVIIVAAVYGPNPEHIPDWLTKVLVAVIVLFPYLLFRFATTFIAPPRWTRRCAALATGAIVVWTAFLPKFPAPDAPRPAWELPYLVALIVLWTALTLPVALRLWTSGRGQPTLPRLRMRLLALATLGLNVSIVISGAAGTANPQLFKAITGAIGLASGVAFYLAFAPPGPLRAWWRRAEEASLQRAAVGVSAATTLDEVQSVFLPHIAPLFGGHGALLVGRDHGVIGVHGMDATETESIDAELGSDSDERIAGGLMVLPLRNGWLVVKASAYTPFFGNEEVDLLRSVGAFVDLAVDRAALFEAERKARAEVERASAELESFLYSVSHDLKSPVVALSGYVGYLAEDYSDVLGEEGKRYLQRMTANATYMEDLIHDLLELSRIGRMQTEPSEVDVSSLVGEIAEQVHAANGEASIDLGELPVVYMNPVRARQLFTNLVENAVHHAGRKDVHVKIASENDVDGSVEISIADDGRGIQPDYRERVFRVFERLDPEESEGTGIGLSVCRKIVDNLDGRIWVADAPQGTEIRIALPSGVVRNRKKVEVTK